MDVEIRKKALAWFKLPSLGGRSVAAVEACDFARAVAWDKTEEIHTKYVELVADDCVLRGAIQLIIEEHLNRAGAAIEICAQLKLALQGTSAKQSTQS